MTHAQAGWYTDTTDPTRLRWFDGSSWTEHTTPLPPAGAPAPAAPVAGTSAPTTAPYAAGSGASKKPSWFRRHKIMTTTGAAAVVLVGGISIASAGGSAADADGASTSGHHAAASTETPGVGDKVRDGKFEFTVTKVETGVKKVGTKYLNEKAQGEFVLVHMKVENIGDEAQTLDDTAQELTDSKGRTFDADSTADIYLDDANSFYEDINPGNSVKGVVVYDVPKGTDLSTITLHDSVFSGGVDVSLED
ncbi:DUF4352 domain-containing protein [Luteimicrobium subarcticum]|uniref:Uncharacterized protein DUF2510 n=1 Tax=Luteimicrobium subarcticum TaxID=620910 RepID=A0A2M8WUK5_9MICO|nr:DUF4352 domain-containing protein [Luteimicrobium subarcticum]PJI94579.1 uncharacterized protein DUF2510 [Luteimicrobium subarcticum]